MPGAFNGEELAVILGEISTLLASRPSLTVVWIVSSASK